MGNNTRPAALAPQVYSVAEAAPGLRMSARTLYRLIEANRVPYRLLPNGKYGLTQADIDEIIADSYRPAVA